MNICFVTAGHISPSRGGIDRVVSTLTTELRKRGHRVFLLSSWPPKEHENLGEDQFLLPLCGWADQPVNHNFLAEFITNHHIDVIVCHCERQDILKLLSEECKHLHIPLITTIHSDPLSTIKSIYDMLTAKNEHDTSFVHKTWIYMALKFCYRWYSRRKYVVKKNKEIVSLSDRVVVLSSKYIDCLCSSNGNSAKSKIMVIGNPLSYGAISPYPVEKDKLVLYVGRMNLPVKRVDRMLRIWKMANPPVGWHLALLGEGDDLEWLKSYAKKLRLQNVTFEGRVDPEEYYKKAAICCLTSSHEGFGMTLTESRQFGAVPIAFNCSGAISDILLDGKAGVIIPRFKEKIFARELHRLMVDDEYRMRMASKEITEEVEAKYATKTIVDQWEELLKQVILS